MAGNDPFAFKVDEEKMYYPPESYEETKKNMLKIFAINKKFWIKYPSNKNILIGLMRAMFGDIVIFDNLHDLKDRDVFGDKIVMIGPVTEVQGKDIAELRRVLNIAQHRGMRLVVFSDKNLFDALGGIDKWNTGENEKIVDRMFQVLYGEYDLTKYFIKK